MRVLLRPKQDRRDDERGAIAVIVGVLSTFILVLASLTVDVGLAYTYKRQAQTAADAAVLAAATLYVESKVTCGSLDDNVGLNAQAKKLADEMLQKNLPGATGVEWDVSCDNPDAELRVSYTATYDSPLTLGRIASDSDHVKVETPASATFDRSIRGESGMRPWPICSTQAQVLDRVVQIVAGNKTNENCPGMEVSGTWGRYACPGYKKGDMSGESKPTSTLYWIRHGCPNPASPIPGQPLDATDRYDHLANWAECAPKDKNSASSEFCLIRDTGSSFNDNMRSAWQSVIDDGLTFELPILCTATVTIEGVETPGQCSQDAVSGKDGSVLPIAGIAVVTICGFKLEGYSSVSWPTTGPCHTDNPKNYTVSSPTPNGEANVLYLAIKGVISGGDDGTDGGGGNLRLVR